MVSRAYSKNRCYPTRKNVSIGSPIIEQQEHESKLDEKYKLVNIKYVKRAYIISIISIITSIVSMIISAIAIAR